MERKTYKISSKNRETEDRDRRRNKDRRDKSQLKESAYNWLIATRTPRRGQQIEEIER